MVQKKLTNKDKMIMGLEYDAFFDKELLKDRAKTKTLCQKYNQLDYEQFEERTQLIQKIFAKTYEDKFFIEQPFMCDYGYNIEIGKGFFANHNLMIIDCAKVSFGNNVLIGPNCGFYTAIHPLKASERNKGIETAKPIKIGNSVWFGGNVIVLPGITIGDNCVIGAGSIVTKDIPANSVAVGNPCKVIKTV